MALELSIHLQHQGDTGWKRMHLALETENYIGLSSHDLDLGETWSLPWICAEKSFDDCCTTMQRYK
jgi:hypothetical protein